MKFNIKAEQDRLMQTIQRIDGIAQKIINEAHQQKPDYARIGLFLREISFECTTGKDEAYNLQQETKK